MRTHAHSIVGSVVLASSLLLAAAPPLAAKEAPARLGEPSQVNRDYHWDQIDPAIAADSQGNYAVAWILTYPGGETHVYVRLFDAGGRPRSDDILVDGAPHPDPHTVPRIAMAADGRFAVLWTSEHHLWMRPFDARGLATAGFLQADDVSHIVLATGDLAATPDGRWVVAWSSQSPSPSIHLRSFDAAGRPLEAPHRVDAGSPKTLQPPRLAVTSEGDVIVAFIREHAPAPYRRDDEILGVRRKGLLGPVGTEMVLGAATDRELSSLGLAPQPDQGFSMVWLSTVLLRPPASARYAEVHARRFDSTGVPVTPEKTLPFASSYLYDVTLAADSYGNTFVAVVYLHDLLQRNGPAGQLFRPDWTPVGNASRIDTVFDYYYWPAAVTASGNGFVAAWATGIPYYVTIWFGIPFITRDGEGAGIFSQRFAPPLCAEGSKVLCLGKDGRFELSVEWTTPAGDHGEGRAHPISGDTGVFWFFEPSNLELLTKVLDGTAINDHHWYFSGALSDVDYTVKVRDTASGEEKTYHNPQGQVASRADTQAFASAVPAAGSLAPAAPASASAVKLSPPILCDDADPATLCLPLEHPFHVTVDFVDPRTGQHGTAQPLPLTDNTGAFSFFDPDNLELVVKVLDGRAVNGRFWVFYGGLSDVEYTISVQDLTTLDTKTYTNPRGRLESRADTAALP